MTNQYFKKGDAAVLAGGGKYPEYMGTKCKVLSELGFAACKTLSGETVMRFGYKVETHDGKKFRVSPRDLEPPMAVH